MYILDEFLVHSNMTEVHNKTSNTDLKALPSFMQCCSALSLTLTANRKFPKLIWLIVMSNILIPAVVSICIYHM